jgi:hypothetical protein
VVSLTNDRYKISRVRVEIVVGSNSSKDKALLQSLAWESLVLADTPSVDSNERLVDADRITGSLDFGVLLADLLGPQQLLGLQRGL